MRALPLDIGTLHFVGIGGIGMSGIAEVLHNLGYGVQGSDIAESANVKRLRKLGIPINIGHREANLGEAAVVVISSAVKADNPELAAARRSMIPVVPRAEMLAELMRLKWSIAIGGTHGKTTTTSLVATMLDAAQLDPTVINGGIINAYGTNARLGQGNWLVAEADESDGTFVKLPATIAIVTNIDPEHLDHYQDFDRLRQAFDSFVQSIPFYGFAAVCIDHPEVQAMIPRVSDRRLITYGFSPQADVRGVHLKLTPTGSLFDVEITDRLHQEKYLIEGFELPVVGRHNVQNTLAAITVGIEMGLDDETLRTAFRGFAGVKRRFTHTGTTHGITVIDDYGHHPVEIKAVLAAARQALQQKADETGRNGRRVIAVIQPHRYSRLSALFEDFCGCFNDADCVIVAGVHAAGETPLPGYDRDTLVEGLRMRGHRNVLPLLEPEQLPRLVGGLAKAGDMVVCLGAGSITNWANALPGQLLEMLGPEPAPAIAPAPAPALAEGSV